MSGRLRPVVVRIGVACALLLTAAAGEAQAPGAGRCTVSILNRSATVRSDGTWDIFNIPSNMGFARARLTCTDGGQTRNGASERFLIAQGRMNAIPPIDLDAAPPAPARVAISTPLTLLTSPGQTVQLAVTATFADGSAIDVTAGAEGTLYGTTNPGIATVSADGLVTALASGRVLVTALHEAVLAAVALDVLVSGDSDGDGIPDDLELGNGLDPNDPLDALADFDGDGLTNREELLDFGTDLRATDTDGDGLEDGREVRETGTEPLLFDTDGDRVSDGLELLAGSDPLDPDDVDLAPVLAGLTVTPESFTLVFNTLYGEASRQLQVTATLIDGSAIDATAARYGTSYSSSNPAVAGFGAQPGRVFAGAAGIADVTATLGAFSVDSLVRVETFSPTALSFIALPGSPNGVAVADGYAFVASGAGGLQVVDVGDPAAPQLAGSAAIPGAAFEVAVAGGVAYVAAGAGGLQVVDVVTPSAPVLIGTAPTPGAALDVVVVDAIAFVVDGIGLRVFDVSDPAAPFEIAGIDLPGRPRGVDAGGGLAVVAAEAAGVHLVDVSDPADPILVGTATTRPNGTSDASAVLLRESTVYVADGARTLGGLKVIDVSLPSTPVVIGASNDRFGLNEVAADGRFVFAADYFFSNAVPIFNVEPQPPLFAATLNFAGAPSGRDDNGHGLAVADGLVYLAGDRTRTVRFGLAGNGGLHVGRYARAEEEPQAPQPPTVAITSPVLGAVFRERTFVRVSATAQDDVRVDRVEFTVAGQVVATDFGSPYAASVAVPVGAGDLALGAIAFDSAGNSAVAEPVVITVTPDSRPTVRLLAPVGGSSALEGRTVTAAAEATDDIGVDRVEFTVDGEVVETTFSPPHQVSLSVPVGVSAFTVAAVAYDTVEQAETSAPVVVAVDPDLPPEVAILAPADGDEAIEGAAVRVVVGAADDYGLDRVTLLADGEAVATLGEPPFEFVVRAALGATVLTLAAEASDDLDQTTLSAPVVLTVVPDPGTTVEGRVVDAGGEAVAGAEVTCGAAGGLSAGDGSFSVTGVATVSAAISCRGEAAVGGEVLIGTTAPVPPVAGGITEVGSLVVLPQLLYLGAGDHDGFFPPGRLLVYDDLTGRLLPWSEPFSPSGISGLAFDAFGALYATTLEPGPQQLHSGPTPGARGTATGSGRLDTVPVPLGGGFGETSLVRLDPDSGEVLAEIGRLVDAEDDSVVIEDLAFDPVSERLFGIDAESFGDSVLYSIDPATAVATPVLTGLSLDSAALTVGGDGLLYLVGLDLGGGGGEEIVAGPGRIAAPGVVFFDSILLWAIDPADGTVVFSGEIDGTLDDRVGGMVPDSGGRLLVASGKSLYPLDLAGLTLGAPATPAGSHDGTLQALALRPLIAPPVTTTVVGLVTVEDGVPAAGVPVSTLGATTITDAAGGFELPGVIARTPRVRAVAENLGEVVLSAAVPPVPAGVTDVGTLEVGETVCVTGVLSYQGDCRSGPVTALLQLEVLGDDDWFPVGTVAPEPDGSFCADIRRGTTFRVTEETTCDCGFSTFCEAFLEVFDPDAEGRCEDFDPACEELGAVEMWCDSSCSVDL